MSANFSAVLLAGGKSSRMGQDKALLEIGGMPLWKRQLAILQELHPYEIFIAGPAREEWRNHFVIPDAQSDAGPLAGLISALRRRTTSRLLVLAVDLPNMTANYLRMLLDDSSKGIGVVPQANKRFEPLAAVYPAATLATAEDCLSTHNYSMQHLARKCVAQRLVRPRDILPDDYALFTNLNTPEDVNAM